MEKKARKKKAKQRVTIAFIVNAKGESERKLTVICKSENLKKLAILQSK